MDLDFVRIECECITETPVQLASALYDALRYFGTHFRDVCCTQPDEACTSCANSEGCPYRSVFAQELSPDPEIVRLHQKPALPFSLYVQAGSGAAVSHCMGMVVIGRALNHLGMFHAALLKTVHAALSTNEPRACCHPQVFCLDYSGSRHEISSSTPVSESVILLSGSDILRNTVPSDSARLLISSPLRLLTNGFNAHHFDFATFFRSQLRRCSSLCAYYGTGEIELDYAGLSEQSDSVAVFNDKITYTHLPWSRRVNKSGLLGSAECIGLTEQMFPLLLLGSYFNAGKGATFGSGFHTLEVL
ncbi:MAG: CRISPR system precrRNA processing endoribonuclease RAMP protein Cas6 [Desulfuromonadaceae bacterium]|nr:CRISPR system precrRNA processing endoribonuclease RAMP protein Cas6 [Desulfuromonadaceae bacterium]